jgi:hypothetical protein
MAVKLLPANCRLTSLIRFPSTAVARGRKAFQKETTRAGGDPVRAEGIAWEGLPPKILTKKPSGRLVG